VPPPVRVVAVVQYLGGALALAFAALCVYAAASIDPNEHDPLQVVNPRNFAVFLVYVAAFCTVAGVVALGLGLMLQRGHRWAQVVLIALNLLTAPTVLVVMLAVEARVHVLWSLLPLLWVGLLVTPRARAWFRPIRIPL
jgi:hypothetical protein